MNGQGMSDEGWGTPDLEDRGPFTWHVFVLAAVAIIALFSRFFRANTFGFFEDDFFYYLLPARNFAWHGFSSFDGTHLTNGYHPLWFLILACLLRFFSGTAFLVAAQIVTFAAIVVFYFTTLRLLRSLGLHPDLCGPLALLLSLHTLLLFRYGMEVTVSIPLGLLTFAYINNSRFQWTHRQTILYGLLACLTVLGRLDSILLFILLLAFQTLTSDSSWPTRLLRIALFSAGFSPFLLYLGINKFFFGTALPVTAAAKQMKPLFPISDAPLIGLFQPFDRMKAAFIYPVILILFLGLIQLVRSWNILSPARKALYLALLLFPILQNIVLCVMSDWGLWPWYYYPLVYSTFAGAVLLLSAPAPLSARSRFVVFTVPILFYASYVVVYAVWKQPSSIALIGSDIAAWMRQHPASYAMGDEAGTTAYLSGQPILQTEGLLEDRQFLTNIRERRPLGDVLRAYGVRYYVVLYAHPINGCYNIAEPSNAGVTSPHMLGRICAEPLTTATRSGATASLFRVEDIR
jgi:hypothetical protein